MPDKDFFWFALGIVGLAVSIVLIAFIIFLSVYAFL